MLKVEVEMGASNECARFMKMLLGMFDHNKYCEKVSQCVAYHLQAMSLLGSNSKNNLLRTTLRKHAAHSVHSVA